MAQGGWASEGEHQAAGSPSIQIVTGMYGIPDAKRVLDIAARIQDLCGTSAERCSVFCSDSSFGRYNVGRKPICRVTYRCGSAEVRSVEASREELILMRCPERRSEPDYGQALPAPSMTN